MTQDPKAQQLAGVWSHSHSLWLSREHQRARDLASALEATCFNGEEEPTAVEPPDQEPAHDWGNTDLDRWLTKIHINTGHVPGSQMAYCLKEAGYDKTVVSRCRELRCALCDKFRTVVPARPTKMMRSRVLGKVVAMDLSYHTFQNTKFQILHLICEASRFHYSCVFQLDGNLSSSQLVEVLPQWTTFLGYPSRWHVDAEGCCSW